MSLRFQKMLWLSRDHFELSDPWEHINFQVRATYDVVGGSGWRIAYQKQPASELWWVREGTVSIELGDKHAVVAAPGIAVLHPAPARDTRLIAGNRLSILGFSFDATLWGAFDLTTLLEIPVAPPVLPTLFEEILAQMLAESRERRPGYALAVGGLGQLAFVRLLRALELDDAPHLRQKTRLAGSPELVAALNLVAARFDQPLGVADLARAAHLSPKHFGKKFGAALGLTPMEFLRRFRLGKARDLLLSSDQTAARVGVLCGFEDAAHFSRAFKAEFGLSPGEFRARFRQGF